MVREHRLKPVAVLVTHGHVDHMWCVAPVAGTYDATAWIHPADRHLLADPMAGMSPETAQMLLGGDYSFAEPDDVQELGDLQDLELAGLRFVVDHTPGHTEGSVTFRSPYDDATTSREVMFSGDLLFAGLDRPHRPARRRPPDDAAQPGDQGAAAGRRHRRAARPRRADLDRPRAGDQPVPPGPAGDPSRSSR